MNSSSTKVRRKAIFLSWRIAPERTRTNHSGGNCFVMLLHSLHSQTVIITLPMIELVACEEDRFLISGMDMTLLLMFVVQIGSIWPG
jgi:hypothetical protein